MMEEWRPAIVDCVVMSMVNGNEIKLDNFYISPDTNGIVLEKAGFKAFIAKLEKRFAATSRYLPYADYPVGFRRAIYLQAGELAKAIEQGDPELYTPVIIR